MSLNVFVSKQAAQAGGPLPVLVWFHGGATKVGAARDYDPSKLAIDGGALVVTLNYRLACSAISRIRRYSAKDTCSKVSATRSRCPTT